ncbi:hypothetical protein N7470_005638 [Penicillium chermesinum]|nr:hypothetical protein N7470_005638 [Penicillium chermesinum]
MEIQKEEPPLDRDLILSRIDHSAQNPDIGFIETLYRTCTAVLVHLWKYGNRPTPGSRENILRKDIADLSRWDENFLPGNLDATIEQSHHLRINVIENLVGIGKILVSSSAPAETPVDTKEKTRLRITPHQELRTQLEKAKIILSTEEHSDSCLV